MSVIFDTLAYAKELREAGVPEPQAEAHVRGIARIVDDQLATKRDIEELKIATKRDIEDLKISTKRDLTELELRLKAEIEIAKTDMIRWVGGMLVAQAAVIAALVKLL